MNKVEGLLIIGGTSKNAGKTTLVAKTIHFFSRENNIVAVKISCHPPDGNAIKLLNASSTFTIYEEQNKALDTDTSLMFRQGAAKVYFIHAQDIHIEEAFLYILSKRPDSSLIISESNSLINFYEPDLFILAHNSKEPIKKSAENIIKKASYIIDTKKISALNIGDVLSVDKSKWQLINKK